jgi:transcriptional regulator with XRE-family HTH domain
MAKPQSEALKSAQEAFAPKLRHLMALHKTSQSKLESDMKRAGGDVSQKTISNIQRGEHNTQIGNMAALADHFGVPLWVMLVPDLPLEMLSKDRLKRLEALLRDYLACDTEGRTNAESAVKAFSKISGK